VNVMEMGGRLWNSYGIQGSVPLIIMHGFRRGDFYRGDHVRIKNPFVVRVHPAFGEPFIALLTAAWFDVDIVRRAW